MSRFFPPVRSANEDGLLALGGNLSVDWLEDAYRHGIFPWPIFEDENMVAWWSPDPRAILELDGLHVSRRLLRTCRSKTFRVTLDQDFAGVVRGCATAAGRETGTWLTPPMIEAYCRFHEAGVAHSVEVWHDNELAGGMYGVAIGGIFSGESMFYRRRDASKVALVALVEHLRSRGYVLLDIQQLTPHMARLGAIEIPRARFLHRLNGALDLPVTFADSPT